MQNYLKPEGANEMSLDKKYFSTMAVINSRSLPVEHSQGADGKHLRK
jgi:hypothetical protein